ncbi:MAG: dihydrolipoyllysine-residue succinyltransferase [Flavobacteriales bacterium]|nr:dihydrolipoyllysine-residue succinyltransferase [Flavobacteriales bacterium]
MLLEMKVPSPGESISEVEIAEWVVQNGDIIQKDQTIAEIDSDKATLELPAEVGGKINILVEEGEVVKVGDVVCTIDTSFANEENTSQLKEKEIKESEIINTNLEKIINKATPLAASIIDKQGILSESIKGTGISGKITRDDVMKSMAISKQDKNRTFKQSKMSSLRRKISSRLVSVKNETAMLTTFNEVDMSEILKIRKKYKQAFEEVHGVGLGFMSFFTKAVTEALLEFKDVNAMINGDEIIHYDYCDIGIAVSAPKGLMVPVVRNAQSLSFSQIENEIKNLALKARDGKITIEEMMGGTFTITNGGVFGSMMSTPIINPPQSAILGMHNIVERPVVVDGKVVVRPIMYVALSYDHRIIDGRESVGFLCKVKEAIEDPINNLMKGKIKESLEI